MKIQFTLSIKLLKQLKRDMAKYNLVYLEEVLVQLYWTQISILVHIDPWMKH